MATTQTETRTDSTGKIRKVWTCPTCSLKTISPIGSTWKLSARRVGVYQCTRCFNAGK